jgi:hypothetical protein
MNLKNVQLVTIDNENYLLSDETNNELFVFCVNNEMTIAQFDDLLGEGIQWVKNIAVLPEQIGMVYIESKFDEYHKIQPITNENIETIKANEGQCKVEVNYILPVIHEDVNPTQKLFEPILIDNKVIIHI